jgi:hypothetical protein
LCQKHTKKETFAQHLKKVILVIINKTVESTSKQFFKEEFSVKLELNIRGILNVLEEWGNGPSTIGTSNGKRKNTWTTLIKFEHYTKSLKLAYGMSK